jgi:hypothetical protein
MAKYGSWAELERGVPAAYREAATPEAFRRGMEVIAPPGSRPRETRVNAYGRGVEGKSDLMIERFRRAMFE